MRDMHAIRLRVNGRDQLADASLSQRGGIGVGEVGLGEHEEARGAEAALQRVVIAEGLLQIRQLLAVGEPFHGAYLGAVGLNAEDQAGAHRSVVQDHRAGAADAVLAAQVGAGVAQVVAEHIGQGPAGLDDQVVIAAVNPQRDRVHIFQATSRRLRAALICSGRTGM